MATKSFLKYHNTDDEYTKDEKFWSDSIKMQEKLDKWAAEEGLIYCPYYNEYNMLKYKFIFDNNEYFIYTTIYPDRDVDDLFYELMQTYERYYFTVEFLTKRIGKLQLIDENKISFDDHEFEIDKYLYKDEEYIMRMQKAGNYKKMHPNNSFKKLDEYLKTNCSTYILPFGNVKPANT